MKKLTDLNVMGFDLSDLQSRIKSLEEKITDENRTPNGVKPAAEAGHPASETMLGPKDKSYFQQRMKQAREAGTLSQTNAKDIGKLKPPR